MINLPFIYSSTLSGYNTTVNMNNNITDGFVNKDFDTEVTHTETVSELKAETTHVLVDANRQSYYVKKVCSYKFCLAVVTDKRLV